MQRTQRLKYSIQPNRKSKTEKGNLIIWAKVEDGFPLARE
jgi:hypothetical protein